MASPPKQAIYYFRKNKRSDENGLTDVVRKVLHFYTIKDLIAYVETGHTLIFSRPQCAAIA
jgi:hypothetical protein